MYLLLLVVVYLVVESSTQASDLKPGGSTLSQDWIIWGMGIGRRSNLRGIN